MHTKTWSIISILTALVMVFALAIPVMAWQAPGLANSNALNITISSPSIVYHVGDTIHFSVTVYNPLTEPNPLNKPSFQTGMFSYFTDPHDVTIGDGVTDPEIHTIDFPTIPELLPGESVTFYADHVECVIYDPAASGTPRDNLTRSTNDCDPMPNPSLFTTSTTHFPGGTVIPVITNLNKLDYVINSADLVNNPEVIAFTRTENVEGVHKNPVSNDSAAKEGSISTFVEIPNTNVDITASDDLIESGESVNLTIIENNTGNSALTAPVHVVVLKNGAAFMDLTSSTAVESGTDNNILDIGEHWTWTVNNVVLTETTTFQATGHGMSGDLDVTYTAGQPVLFPDERASVIVQVESPSTMAQLTGSTSVLPPEGGFIDLIITEHNDGSVDIENVIMTVSINGVDTYILQKTGSTSPAVFDGVDVGNDDILGAGGGGETWQWTIPNVNVNETTMFRVFGDGTYGDPPIHVNYQTDSDEYDEFRVTVETKHVPASSNTGIVILIAAFGGTMIFLGSRRIRSNS